MNEGKKDRRDPIRAVKPRNFVAKNAGSTTSGAGAHKDKKKAEKQGDFKHKKQEYAESLELKLAEATSAAVRMQRAADKQRAKSDASLARTPSSIPKPAPKDNKVSEGSDNSDHEAKMAKGELLQIAKNAMAIYQMIHEDDNLDGWVSSYITVANDHLNSVEEQMSGDKVQDIAEAEGEPEGLPEITVELAKHIRDQIGTEGPHAICKSVEWGDGAADDLVILIRNALDDYIEANSEEGVAEGEKKQVQDRKTGQWYDPAEKFKELQKNPDYIAQMKRMGREEGKGWPKRKEQGAGSTQKYEMMMRNGQVKKFIAKDDADAKRIAAGHGAKSVIRLRGGVPAGKIAEQGVAKAENTYEGKLANLLNKRLGK